MALFEPLVPRELTPLQKAIMLRESDYSAAIDRLRSIIENDPEAWDATADLREAVELVRCLRRLLDGRDVLEIHRAFGAPGDFGYETPIGEALAKTYRGVKT